MKYIILMFSQKKLMLQLHMLFRASSFVTRDAVELVTEWQGCSEIHWFLMSHTWQALFSLIGALGTWLMSHSLICAVSITSLTETAGLFFACALGTYTVGIHWHFICQNRLDDLSSVDKTFWDDQSYASALQYNTFWIDISANKIVFLGRYTLMSPNVFLTFIKHKNKLFSS